MSCWIHELKSPDVRAYLERDDVVLFPIGSTEQHGKHLPLSTDAAQAVAVSEGVAERTGVLVAPPIWYGWSPFHLCYPGSFSLRPETLASVVEDVVNSLIHSGFKRIIIVSGHTTMNFVPVDPVALRVRQETGAYVAVADVGLIAKREIAGTLESAYDGHAGEWETSFMLYAYPDLVDMSDVPVNVPEVDKDLFPAHIPGDPRIDGNSYQLYPTLEEYRRSSEPGEGATGDPTLATKEKGRVIFEAMVRNITSVVMEARKHEVTIRSVRVPA